LSQEIEANHLITKTGKQTTQSRKIFYKEIGIGCLVIAVLMVVAVLVFPGSFSHTPDTTNEEPAWSPDGSQIVFTQKRSNSISTLFLMNADGSNVVQLIDNSYLTISFHPSWSPDGKQIVFAGARNYGGNYNFDIYMMNADGTHLTQLTYNSLTNSTPAWSPDGNRIAFDSNRKPPPDINQYDIYLMNTDGKQVIKLTTQGAGDPIWSPDSKQIAFDTLGSTAGSVISLMNVDGTGLIKLTDGPTDIDPAWSPDGDQIAFGSIRNGNNGIMNIYLMNIKSKQVFQLTKGGGGDPAWSPDGRRIAFVAQKPDIGEQIYTMNADGSDVIQLTGKP
jgi:TolB protein